MGSGKKTPKGQLHNPRAVENLTNMGKGRPKGCKNKFTDVKTAFLRAFEQIGHEEALVKYAAGSRTARGHFFEMIARMLPKTMDVDVIGNVTFDCAPRDTEDENCSKK